MKLEQIAVQLYTLRDQCKSPEAIALSLQKVAAIGYQAVQASGLGPIPEADLRELLAKNGLRLCATHEAALTILQEPAKVIDRLHKLGCRHTAYPSPAGFDLASEESVATLIHKLNHAGRQLAEAGLTLSYHNHHQEFRRLNGRLILDRIYAETDPHYLKAELDTYWVQFGGGDPVAWCRKLAGRLPLLHLKDYRINQENQPEFAEIGHGNLDWPRILAAAEEAGCEWYIVEQDRCPADPFESLRLSFEYLKKLAG